MVAGRLAPRWRYFSISLEPIPRRGVPKPSGRQARRGGAIAAFQQPQVQQGESHEEIDDRCQRGSPVRQRVHRLRGRGVGDNLEHRATAGTVTLDNGSTYTLPATVAAADLTVGAKVKVTYDEAGGKMTATAVVPQS